MLQRRKQKAVSGFRFFSWGEMAGNWLNVGYF